MNCLRGDGNVNANNKDRMIIFTNFLSNNYLTQTHIQHKTYHHFLGGGAFDSNIDVIIHSKDAPFSESITAVFCKHDYSQAQVQVQAHVQEQAQVQAQVQAQAQAQA